MCGWRCLSGLGGGIHVFGVEERYNNMQLELLITNASESLLENHRHVT